VEYNYPIIKVYWLSASLTPSSVGLVNDQIDKAWNLQLFPSNWKKGPTALTNDKQENADQIQADNVI
jgi:hypothetical protein